MPTSFPNGVSVNKEIYHGSTEKQITAIWSYLSDNERAGIPDGVLQNVIELKPESTPVIYRNFIAGLSPRGIAVGYPEQTHLAWDVERFCLAKIWHGRFMDAGMHWEGRGPGFQSPLGDHIMTVEQSYPLALLKSATDTWPKQNASELGYRFLGYNLDKENRPTFRYSFKNILIEDFPKPVGGVAGKTDGSFVRTIKISPKTSGQQTTDENLFFRVMIANQIKPATDGWILVDDKLRIRVSGLETTIRDNDGHKELLVPLRSLKLPFSFTEEIVW